MTDSPTPTPLDLAFAEMAEAPTSDAARLRYYERLADAELFLLLEQEAEGDVIAPQSFPVEETTYVLAFDREARLAEFTGGASHYAALSGRALVAMLEGQGLGLGVNLEAPSANLIAPEAVAWLAQTLAHVPEETEAQVEEILPPTGLPEALLLALDAKLATAGGLAKLAYLVGLRFEGGGLGHMLGFVDAVPGAEAALAKAANEALTFSGIEAGQMDVSFFRASDAVTAQLAKVGLRFDLPVAEAPSAVPGANPGMDPTKPPKLL